jgi:hypothetical protein
MTKLMGLVGNSAAITGTPKARIKLMANIKPKDFFIWYIGSSFL